MIDYLLQKMSFAYVEMKNFFQQATVQDLYDIFSRSIRGMVYPECRLHKSYLKFYEKKIELLNYRNENISEIWYLKQLTRSAPIFTISDEDKQKIIERLKLVPQKPIDEREFSLFLDHPTVEMANQYEKILHDELINNSFSYILAHISLEEYTKNRGEVEAYIEKLKDLPLSEAQKMHSAFKVDSIKKALPNG